MEVVRALARILIERGHEVTIYSTDAFAGGSKSKTKKGVIIENGIKIYYFNDLSYNIAPNHHLFFSPSMLAVAKKDIRDFDIIHLQDYRNFHNIIVHHYATKFNVPYILQPHGSLPRMITKHWLKKIYDMFWGYSLLEDACRVVAITPFEAKQIKDMRVGDSKIVTLPNGIDFNEFSDLPERGRFRHRYSIGNDQKVLLFLGRIHKIKGLDTLVKAFARLATEIAGVRLVIVGPDDGYEPQLRNLIKELGISDKTLLTGPLYSREKSEVYVDSDIFILPSIYEIFGITVLEACASGIPIILTEQCGIAPWVVDGKAGLSVPAGNVELLKIACHQILTDNSLGKSLGEHGRQLVKEHFSLTRIAIQLEDIYDSCLGKK